MSHWDRTYKKEKGREEEENQKKKETNTETRKRNISPFDSRPTQYQPYQIKKQNYQNQNNNKQQQQPRNNIECNISKNNYKDKKNNKGTSPFITKTPLKNQTRLFQFKPLGVDQLIKKSITKHEEEEEEEKLTIEGNNKEKNIKYRFQIGGGNSSCVYVWKNDTKFYAVKVVPFGSSSSIQWKQAEKEIKILQNLQKCEYICKLHDYIKSKNSFKLIFEYMHAGNLTQCYKYRCKNGKMEEKYLSEIAYQIIEALVYIHEECPQVIIHRDIKPDNILINKHGIAKLADFGISKTLQTEYERAETHIGTQMYFAPERFNEKSFGTASDIWALGVSLLEAAIGRFPFCKEGIKMDSISEFTIMRNYKLGYRNYIKEGEISEGFKIFLDGCLQMNPENRKKASELREDDWITCSNENLHFWIDEERKKAKQRLHENNIDYTNLVVEDLDK